MIAEQKWLDFSNRSAGWCQESNQMYTEQKRLDSSSAQILKQVSPRSSSVPSSNEIPAEIESFQSIKDAQTAPLKGSKLVATSVSTIDSSQNLRLPTLIEKEELGNHAQQPGGYEAPNRGSSGYATSYYVRFEPITYLQIRKPQLQYPDFHKDTSPNSIPAATFQIKHMNEVRREDLMNSQVFFTQNSWQEYVVHSLHGQKVVFEDTDFAHRNESLVGYSNLSSYTITYRFITVLDWYRFSHWFASCDIFTGPITPYSIVEGIFGTSYLTAGLSALAEKPQRIRDLFIWPNITDSRIVACTIIFRGKWKTIYVDDYFPFPKPYYTSAGYQGCSVDRKNSMWVSLLEKAWAKLHGSYLSIEYGDPQQILHDFTGAHMKFIHTRRMGFDKEQTWQCLSSATTSGYAIVAGTPQRDVDREEIGMDIGHFYTVLSVWQLAGLGGSTFRLVKLRYPCRKPEWQFDWSQDDPRWNSITAEEKNRVGFQNFSDEKEFFMSFDDFCESFGKISIAEVVDGASYVYCTQSAQNTQERYFQVSILQDGWYSFQISQTPMRVLVGSSHPQYKPVTMNIGQLLPGGGIQWHRGTHSNHRTVFRKLQLTKGEYIIFAKQQFHSFDPLKNITLAVFGQYYCEVSPAPASKTAGFHEKLFLSRARLVATPIASSVLYSQEILQQEGIVYAAVLNQSPQPVRVRLIGRKNLNQSVESARDAQFTIAPRDEFIVFKRIPTCNIRTSNICSVHILK